MLEAFIDYVRQRKVVVLREVKKETWPDIAASVRNLGNETPSVSTVQRYYRFFSARRGRVRTKYDNCGRHPHKVTKDIERFLVTRLRQLRLTTVCTARTLQHELARTKGVKLSGVSPIGPAAKAGVKGGDVIIKLSGKDVLNIYDYTSLMGELKIGQETTITVLREGRELTLKLTPGSRE